MRAAFMTVFRSPARALTAMAIAGVVLAAAILLPNLALLRIIAADNAIDIGRKLAVASALLGSLTTNFTPLAATYTVLAALLIGVNAVLALYLVARAWSVGKGATAGGLLGLVSGIFGIGCAACGSIVLAAVAGTAVGAGFLALLPLDGQEAGILGVALLGSATYALLRRIGEPLVCVAATHPQPSTT